MKKKFIKILKKISFTNFFFFVLSIISTTFAWFAFSNVVNNQMDVNVKAWNISITDDNNLITNVFTLNVGDIYPGSEFQSGEIVVTNNGDLSACVFYRIKGLRIFDREIDINTINVIDNLALDYPFTFNFRLTGDVINPGESVTFNYSIDWPTDSGNNELDSEWGNIAANFINNENTIHDNDSSYKIRSSISLDVELVVEQNVSNKENSLDYGSYKYFNSVSLDECNVGDNNCFLYYKLSSDDNGTYYMGDLNYSYENAIGSSLNSYNNIISLNDILKVIKNDIYDSKFVISNYSDRIIGNVSNINLFNTKIDNLINNNGYISFSKNQYYFLQSNTCYWLNTSYDSNHYFAVVNYSNDYVKIYSEDINNSCKVIPIIYIENNNTD